MGCVATWPPDGLIEPSRDGLVGECGYFSKKRTRGKSEATCSSC